MPSAETIWLRAEVARLQRLISEVRIIIDSLAEMCGQEDCDTCATLRTISDLLTSPDIPERQGE